MAFFGCIALGRLEGAALVMKAIYRRGIRLLAGTASAALVLAVTTPSGAAEGSAPQIVAQAGNPAGATDDRQILLQRL